jgi:hypothetical protein
MSSFDAGQEKQPFLALVHVVAVKSIVTVHAKLCRESIFSATSK